MSVSRRDFLALLGTSVAATAAVAAGVSASLHPAGTAQAADGSWIVEQIGAVSKGAVPITLRHDRSGEILRIEACRRGLAANPVARSAHFDLFIANDGRGHAQTARGHVAAAHSLAEHLDRNVKTVPDTVLTMRDRLSAHADLHGIGDDVRA
ncbi:MAG: hypothetical protein EXR77_12260 [Myxococcales bacterium]|nr:hypothetical protein [Myxococcales bacterium]